ncbi:hypothetical protein A2368_04390 [Candidatus Collierbacteria bacterium RIFOXYB1_FULL_49_13]|uniref:Glycosyltransferase RgtA/B/C/D-like domain-containing protein n=1 Tax=Candidatus Collierbacteria bacterium RIFOXYB1_FULL_49_13 TaxID=1817728 RepID=A0A1F5FFV9_9BACT|nr:MAG: hypothetical protein A2368_04390 [Candidatus Collierbacteria bacterium RIFOXYB1_FULL_49_13]
MSFRAKRSAAEESLPLLAVLLLASFLRLYQLNTLPISLFGDEIDVGYHALSLWTTGKDYLGNSLPTYIQSLAEHRAPLLMYVTAPFVGLLGLSAFSVRLPVALLGILNVAQIYFLTNLLFSKQTLNHLACRQAGVQGDEKRHAGLDPASAFSNPGLIAAAILAITPWHIHYSRAAFESTLLLSLILCGTYCFLKYLQSPKFLYSLFPVPFALAFYTYSTANVFVPLFALVLALINIKKILPLLRGRPRGGSYFSLFLGLILVIPILYQILLGPAASRFQGISVFTDTRITDTIVTLRTEPWATSSLERLFHNKLTATFAPIAKNYLESFSPQFLFIHGDLFNRHSVTTYGELLAITLPFLILGFVFLVIEILNNNPSPAKGRAQGGVSKQSALLLLFWFFLSPLPSALTREGGMHATRLFLMVPPLIIITANGFITFIEQINKYYPSLAKGRVRVGFLLTVICLLTTVNFASYWHYYTTHYRYLSAPIWQSGYEEIFTQLQPRLASAKRVFINNTHEPSLLRFAFYTKLPPRQFQADFKGDVPTDQLLPHFNGFQLGDKYYFGRVDKYENLSSLLQPGDIYLAVQLDEVPGDWDWSKTPPAGLKTLDLVKNPRSQPQFYLLTHD